MALNTKCLAMNYRLPTLRKSQLLVAITFTLVVMTFYYFEFWENTFDASFVFRSLGNDTEDHDRHIVKKTSGFLVHTPGCRIPELNPFDKSVLKYLKSQPEIQCSDKLPLIQSNQTSIWVDENALDKYNLSSVSDMNCCYSFFGRVQVDQVDPKKVDRNIENMLSMHTKCKSFQKSADIFKEFIQVTCYVNDTLIYKDYHAFVVPKERHPDPEYKSEPEGLSILIVGVDSLSRQNYYRQMPKTKDFLLSLGAIEFFGYNKVHDNTFPNLVPLLSGYSAHELQKLCWHNDSDFFDNCPWMWNIFSARNYYTAFAEDCVNIGLFTYLKSGFINQPTDYYLRPYLDANERFIGHTMPLNTKYCVGARVTVEVLMDYAYKFTSNMTRSGKKFWGFFWESSLTHDFLNVPPNNDNIYLEFFRKLEEDNTLNSTFVVFMSDHGMRWGPIRQTYQGRMESNLPYLYLLLPDWFKEKYGFAMRNMKRNTHLLTTHYDLRETILDVLDAYKLNEDILDEREAKEVGNRGISLFLPIPVERTCESAGIAPTWCTCQTTKRISVTEKYVKKAAKMAVNHLNVLLSGYKECAKLKLKKVWSALLEDEEKMLKSKAVDIFSDYIVNFETKPGDAKFEATVRHRSGNNEMTVQGEINRINMYGNQSSCVPNYRLKRYCYCIE